MRKNLLLILLLVLACFPTHAQEKEPVVNVYIDNTGSMFGYISHGNEFEWAISNLLTSINLSGFSRNENIHLYYINSEIFPYRGSVSSFINGVTVHNAQTYKGDLGKTCMSNFFSKVLNRTGSDTVSIIISDFIISPGKGSDAATVLASEKNAISGIVKSKINKQKDLTIAMYRLRSNFKGKFFDCLDAPKTINAERPYYMLVISSKPQIKEFKKNVPAKSIDDGSGRSAVTNSYVFFNATTKKTPKYVVMSPSSGSVKEGASGITKAKLGADGKFRFTVAVNLSKYSLLGKYLTEPSSYAISNNQYKIIKVTKVAGAGTTHKILIETESAPSPISLTISLKNKVPTWVADYNVDACDCGKIFDEENKDKTFGIKTITDAVFNAFYYNKQELTKFEISINQKN